MKFYYFCIKVYELSHKMLVPGIFSTFTRNRKDIKIPARQLGSYHLVVQGIRCLRSKTSYLLFQLKWKQRKMNLNANSATKSCSQKQALPVISNHFMKATLIIDVTFVKKFLLEENPLQIMSRQFIRIPK